MLARLQLKLARVGVLLALLVIGPEAPSANAAEAPSANATGLTIASLRGSWQATLLWSGGGCGPSSGLLNFTFGLNGTTSTATLIGHSAGCGNSSTTQTFTVQSLRPNGSGTANLSCGRACGWQLIIQVDPTATIFNLVDVDPANPGNFVEGTAIKQ
jgi:hypothetical protein